MHIGNGVPAALEKERREHPRIRSAQHTLDSARLGGEVPAQGRIAAQHDLEARARHRRSVAQRRADVRDQRGRRGPVQRAAVRQDEEAGAGPRRAELSRQRRRVPGREHGDAVAGLRAGGVVVEDDEGGGWGRGLEQFAGVGAQGGRRWCGQRGECLVQVEGAWRCAGRFGGHFRSP